MVASISWIHSALNFLVNLILLRYLHSKYLNFASFSNDLFSTLKQWFCPAVWWRDVAQYLHPTAFAARPTDSLASNRRSVFFVIIFMVSPNKLMTSAQNRSWLLSLIPSPFYFVGPSWNNILKKSLKATEFKSFLVSDHSEYEMNQTNVYLSEFKYRFHLDIVKLA
jgi:hypothetical protein